MSAFDYSKDNSGLATEDAYPYMEVATAETSPVSVSNKISQFIIAGGRLSFAVCQTRGAIRLQFENGHRKR